MRHIKLELKPPILGLRNITEYWPVLQHYYDTVKQTLELLFERNLNTWQLPVVKIITRIISYLYK